MIILLYARIYIDGQNKQVLGSTAKCFKCLAEHASLSGRAPATIRSGVKLISNAPPIMYCVSCVICHMSYYITLLHTFKRVWYTYIHCSLYKRGERHVFSVRRVVSGKRGQLRLEMRRVVARRFDLEKRNLTAQPSNAIKRHRRLGAARSCLASPRLGLVKSNEFESISSLERAPAPPEKRGKTAKNGRIVRENWKKRAPPLTPLMPVAQLDARLRRTPLSK